ncbi:type I restriction enzyme S subunit [Devosia subaequoris]|uniref:Type I restriction enzyme S subunit n=1 Tax=Devosia subaequoris TaxID=395930 RepID=A0A7W6IQP2_9HYPH|nr:restriction endonuclease subunit S [Devosia subaequoris]MBB4053527.1 type I restriction enzyme S subunit [Devosia subaequoris]MCP1211265.1 restriction endonuclease subunit S [Devosia subaequoris]
MKYRQTVGRTDSPPRGWIKAKLSDCLHMKSGDMITAKRIVEVEAYPVYGGNGLRGFTDSFNREGAHSLIGRQGALCGAVHFADGQFYASEHAIVAKALGKNDQRFLTYVLDALNLNEVSEASAQPGLSVEKLRSIEILCPKSPDEQQAIAAALSDADGVVAGLERVIAKKRLIKQGAMQDLLTARRRLPGFSGEWEVKRIGQLANGFSGGTPSTQDPANYGGSIQWITSSDLNQALVTEVSGRITEKGLRSSAAKMVQPGMVLLALYGATAGVSAVCNCDGAINQAILALGAHACDAGFLFHLLQASKDLMVSTLTQGGQPNLSGALVKNFEVRLPADRREQQAIATVLSDMDAEIQTLESRLAKARAVKEGMMQNLLTGRVRLV